jgi:hypothetical protein
MRPNDAILKEGFLLVAGAYETDQYIDMMNELVQSYRDTGVRWSVIASELGNTYVPPGHVSFPYWLSQGWIDAGSCYVGPTGESVGGGGRPLSTCSLYLVAPAFCGSQNNKYTYDQYRAWADGFSSTVGAGGGMGFTYVEARLGTFTGTLPFCPNDPQMP